MTRPLVEFKKTTCQKIVIYIKIGLFVFIISFQINYIHFTTKMIKNNNKEFHFSYLVITLKVIAL